MESTDLLIFIDFLKTLPVKSSQSTLEHISNKETMQSIILKELKSGKTANINYEYFF